MVKEEGNDDEQLKLDNKDQQELEKKKPTPSTTTTTRVREVFNVGANQYVLDIFPGAAPPLSPGDTIIISKSLPGGGTLQIIKKAGSTPTPTPTPTSLIASDFSETGTQNKPLTIDFSGHVTDVPGSTITSITVVTQPNSGTISNISGTTATYTPNNNFAGTDTFTWKATDSRGSTSDVAQATISIQQSGGASLDVSDVSYTTAENTPLQIVLSVNGGQGPYTWNESTPHNGSLTGAQLPVSANETALTYTPNSGSSGTDSFTYSAKDSKGNVSNTATVTITISAPIPLPPTGAVDQYGIAKIYNDWTASPASNWFMDMNGDPNADPRANNPEASSSYKPKFIKSANPDVDGFKIKGQIEIRGAITQNEGYDQSKMCTDFTKCRQQGYMQSNMDWGAGNVGLEMTAAYRINKVGSGSTNGEPHLEHVMKGQRSTTSNSTFGGPCGCALGCSDNYHCNIYCNRGTSGSARQKYEKDLFHTSGYSKDIAGVNNNSAYNFVLGQWFIVKTVVYNISGGSVQLEHWTNENADKKTFKKTHSFVDHDQWPPRGSIGNCNVPSSASGSPPITFGGPLTVFRSDNLEDYDVKWLSIRSIDPSKRLMQESEHNKTFPIDDFVEEDDVIYQEEKWHNEEDTGTSKSTQRQTKEDDDIAKKAKIDAQIIAKEAEDPKIKKAAETVAKKVDINTNVGDDKSKTNVDKKIDKKVDEKVEEKTKNVTIRGKLEEKD